MDYKKKPQSLQVHLLPCKQSFDLPEFSSLPKFQDRKGIHYIPKIIKIAKAGSIIKMATTQKSGAVCANQL